MLHKKYSPIVLSKANMFAFSLAERAIRYVLQDEMIRLLHVTIDSTVWTEEKDNHNHKSEISTSVLCRGHKLIEVEAEIILSRYLDGEWGITSGIKSDRIRFPGCKALKGFWIYFLTGGDREIEKIKLGYVWQVDVESKSFSSPQDDALVDVRRKLLA